MSLSDFVGIPHAELGRDRAGCDGYGRLRLVYAEVLGSALPSFTGTYATCAEHAQIAALLTGEAAAGPWQPVTRSRPYDALLFRVGRHDCHVAVAVDRARMLHVHARSRAVIVPRADPTWRDRFSGAFRHEALL